MKRVEMEFDVHKLLTVMLETEEAAYSDVIQRIDMRGARP